MRGPQDLESALGVKAQWYTPLCLGPEKRFWVQTQTNWCAGEALQPPFHWAWLGGANGGLLVGLLLYLNKLTTSNQRTLIFTLMKSFFINQM
jgi:hypothetical protein